MASFFEVKRFVRRAFGCKPVNVDIFKKLAFGVKFC